MSTDFLLASLHHLFVFALVGLLAAEWVLLRRGLSSPGLALLARLDRAYGGLAGGVLLIGAARVVWGLKGWEYYMASHAFWPKMAAFALVGLLSIRPTIAIIGWSRRAAVDPGYVVPDSEIDRVRRFLNAEVFVFALIPVLAAAMARGMG